MNQVDHGIDFLLLPLLGVFTGYALGCFNTGYYLVRWKTGQDLRRLGSGNAGAKNTSRALGTWGFAVSFLGDILKGALAVAAAQFSGFPLLTQGLVMLAAIAGHNWPAQLGFRGGKGLSVSYGALLFFDPVMAGVLFGLCAVWLAATRRFTLSAMGAYALAPVAATMLGRSPAIIMVFIAFAGLVLYSHRKNISEELAGKPVVPKC
jgi:glycerol-3-phosphate acyltransferase PlsY